MPDVCYTLATHCQITEPVQLDLRQQKTSKTKQYVSNDVNQAFKSNLEAFDPNTISKPDQKGFKLGFEYDQEAPSGFGVAPIKRVPTTMFSLVRIRPMFEQEAPK